MVSTLRLNARQQQQQQRETALHYKYYGISFICGQPVLIYSMKYKYRELNSSREAKKIIKKKNPLWPPHSSILITCRTSLNGRYFKLCVYFQLFFLLSNERNLFVQRIFSLSMILLMNLT